MGPRAGEDTLWHLLGGCAGSRLYFLSHPSAQAQVLQLSTTANTWSTEQRPVFSLAGQLQPLTETHPTPEAVGPHQCPHTLLHAGGVGVGGQPG